MGLKYHDGTQFQPVFVLPKKGTKSFTTLNVNNSGGIRQINESFNNRSLIRKLKVTPANGAVNSYIVEFFTTSAFAAINLEYQATSNGTLIDNEVWYHEDKDVTSLLHLKITNNSNFASTFTIEITQEEFL